jgi:hypothetical protein
MKKVTFLFLYILASFVLMSCSPRIQISIEEDSKTDVQVLSKALPATIALIRSFGALGNGTPALNVEAVKDSFIKSGFNRVYARSSDGISVEIDANAETGNDVFLVLNNAIVYESSSFQMTLSPDTIPEILALVPSNTIEYLDFIMAPLLTGEQMTESEYKEMITSIYGQTIARELSESVFELVITAPKTIFTYEAPPQARVEQRGARITFSLPLTALLVERGNAVYRVEWK